MSRSFRLCALGVVSFSQLAPQLAALFILSAEQFGAFSMGYLVFALASSVSLSVISEAYVRSEREMKSGSMPLGYGAISSWLGLLFGTFSGILFGIIDNSLVAGWAGFFAIYFASRRVPVRYLEIRIGGWRRLLAAESLALTLFVASLVVITQVFNPLNSLLMAWSILGFSQWALGTVRTIGTPSQALDWVKRYRTTIVPLLKDSSILDLSSIGAPYLIAPLLGTVGFGLYRAISNFSAPIRLIINLVRPQIVNKPATLVFSKRMISAVAVISIVFGTIASLIMYVVNRYPIGVEVLDEVSRFALQIGIFVASATLGHYLYINARIHASNRALLKGRIFQSTFAFFLPLIGALSGSLDGAIWMFALATFIGSVCWYVVGISIQRTES